MPEVTNAGYQNADGQGSAYNVLVHPQAFLTEVRTARQENIGLCGFCLAAFTLLLAQIIWIVVILAAAIIPIVMIVIGAVYINDCPFSKMLPIGVTVAGCLALVGNICNCISKSRKSESNTAINCLNGLINLIFTCWFIAICYWVYSAKPQFDDTTHADYCNPHLYGFAFWFANLIFIISGAIIVMYCCLVCFVVMSQGEQ